MVTNSFSYYLSEKVLISPSFLKDSFSEYSIGWQLFSFQQIEYTIPLPLAYKVSAENSANNLIGSPLYMTSHFFLAFFKILPLSVILTV